MKYLREWEVKGARAEICDAEFGFVAVLGEEYLGVAGAFRRREEDPSIRLRDRQGDKADFEMRSRRGRAVSPVTSMNKTKIPLKIIQFRKGRLDWVRLKSTGGMM